MISVYNPNIETQKGFFLTVGRYNLGVEVEQYANDFSGYVSSSVPTEIFCQQKADKDEDRSDLCHVYIDREVAGLSFEYFEVTVSVKDDEENTLANVVPTEIVYKYFGTTLMTVDDYVQLKASPSTPEAFKSVLMDKDVSIILKKPTWQSFTLAKIDHPADPIMLSVMPNGQEFEFSLELVYDDKHLKQKSGHYCMTVKQRTADTERFIAITEI